MNSKGERMRLVRCPKCNKILPEYADIPVYKCGGCSAVLRAKVRVASVKSSVGSARSSQELITGDKDSLASNNGRMALAQSRDPTPKTEMFTSEISSAEKDVNTPEISPQNELDSLKNEKHSEFNKNDAADVDLCGKLKPRNALHKSERAVSQQQKSSSDINDVTTSKAISVLKLTEIESEVINQRDSELINQKHSGEEVLPKPSGTSRPNGRTPLEYGKNHVNPVHREVKASSCRTDSVSSREIHGDKPRIDTYPHYNEVQHLSGSSLSRSGSTRTSSPRGERATQVYSNNKGSNRSVSSNLDQWSDKSSSSSHRRHNSNDTSSSTAAASAFYWQESKDQEDEDILRLLKSWTESRSRRTSGSTMDPPFRRHASQNGIIYTDDQDDFSEYNDPYRRMGGRSSQLSNNTVQSCGSNNHLHYDSRNKRRNVYFSGPAAFARNNDTGFRSDIGLTPGLQSNIDFSLQCPQTWRANEFYDSCRGGIWSHPYDNAGNFQHPSYNLFKPMNPSGNLQMPHKEGRLKASMNHCLPTASAAPFVLCCECCEVLRLPADFLLFRKKLHKLKCGACSKILHFLFLNGFHVRPVLDPACAIIHGPPSSSHVTCSGEPSFRSSCSGNEHSGDVLGDPENARLEASLTGSSFTDHDSQNPNSPLHQLLGYRTPSELIYPSRTKGSGGVR